MTITRILIVLICLPGSGIAGTQQTRQESKRLELDLLLDWETASAPRMSPQGDQIVFTRRWTDKINDKFVSDLWIMDSGGERPRFLVHGSGARWSPDGTRILYLAEGQPRGSQIHVMWIGTREATQITRLERSPSDLRWSPDGRFIAFTMTVPEQDEFKIKLPRRPKGAKWAKDPKVITRLNYRRDRRGYRPKGWQHIFVVDATGGTPRQVTSGDFDHRGAEWLPDGTTLVFSGLRETDADWRVRESEIYSVNVGSGAIMRLTTRSGPDYGPVPSPDGNLIAYLGYDKTDDTYNVAHVHVMRSDGGEARVLAQSPEGRPGSLMWDPSGDFVWHAVSGNGRTHMRRVRLKDGKATRHLEGDHILRVSHQSRSGVIVGTVSTAHQPPVIFKSEGFSKLLDVNADLLARLQLGDVEELHYRSTDGLPIQGWIVKPPGFDPKRKYPLILQIHGGPHAMYGVDFDFERQNHAAEGFVVLYTNPRGSSGYGKAFGNAIKNAYPGKDHDDLMRGVDEVVAREYIDEKNLFVFGGSGGGVLTAWIVGHTDRFRAAVCMYPVIDWISFVGTTDGPYWYTNFKKLPWEDITEHWNRSPLKYVGNVKTPTLLITGELDLRTPMSQTEEFYQALKLRKVESAMIRVPDEYHGAAGRHASNRLRRILYVREWFKRHMQTAPGE